MQYLGALATRTQRAIFPTTFSNSPDSSGTQHSPARLRSLAAVLPAVFLLVGVAHAANVQYTYDAAGRLTGVIDQNGNPAIYNYDASGNITSIVRPAAGSINVLGFSPAFGPIGANITITGTGFSATASQDTVKFNGMAATVVSATTTQIVAKVPSAATTGTISVTSPAGTATSSQTFTVTLPSAAGPSISGFTPTSGGYGDAVTISGSGFGTTTSQETVSFGGAYGIITASSPTSITVKVPSGGTTGPITVSTQVGSATSAASFYMLPSGYNNTNIGAIAAISAYGQSATLNVANANDGYIVKFTGAAGDRVSVNILESGSSMTLSNVSIFSPDGSLFFGPVGADTIVGANPYNPGFLMGPFVLPVSGTYAVLVAPQNGSTGTAQITVYHVPADQTGTLVNGSTVNISLATPGQIASFPFSGQAGQRIYFALYGPTQTYTEGTIAVYNPDGSALYATGPMDQFPDSAGDPNIYASPLLLNQTGTYRLVIAPYQSYLFSGYLSFLKFPTGAAPNITAGGPAVNLTIGTPGQLAAYTFSGTAGERAAFNETYSLSGNNCIYGRLLNPDGSVFQTPAYACGSPNFIAPYTLTQAGNYTFIFTPGSGSTGTVGLTLYSDPPNATGTIVAGGATLTLSANTPGQGMDFLFSGVANERASFFENFTLTGGNCAYGQIFNPDGSVFQTPAYACGPAILGPYTLSQAGTYKFRITPGSGSTGTVSMNYYNEAQNPTATITVGGAAATLTASLPSEPVNFKFSGTSGAQVKLNVSFNVTGGNCIYNVIYNPDGTVFQTPGFACGSTTQGPYTLTQTGTYLITSRPGSGATGTITTSVSN